MSKRRNESLSAFDEQRWQAQERLLRALRERITPISGDERVSVDDAAIFDALSQFPELAPPADFIAAVTTASESLRERRRQLWRFRRALFGRLALTYAVTAGIGLPMWGGANLRNAVLTVQRGLYETPWLATALLIAALIATFSRNEDRQRDTSL